MWGFAPCSAEHPQCSSPFEKGGRTANLNFAHSPLGRRNGVALPLSASVFREKNQWVQVVFPHGNLHPQVFPIDFSSAPVTVVSMVTMLLTSSPLPKRPSRPSPSSRFGNQFQRNAAPSVTSFIFITNVVLIKQPPCIDIFSAPSVSVVTIVTVFYTPPPLSKISIQPS